MNVARRGSNELRYPALKLMYIIHVYAEATT